MSVWDRIKSTASLYGHSEMGKGKKHRIKRSKCTPAGPGVVKKKYNTRRKVAEVKSIDPTGYTPQQTKVQHVPGSLFADAVAAPIIIPGPRKNGIKY